MTKSAKTPDDIVIEEVRRIRAEIWREAGATPEGLIQLLDQRQPRGKKVRRASRKRPKRA